MARRRCGTLNDSIHDLRHPAARHNAILCIMGSIYGTLEAMISVALCRVSKLTGYDTTGRVDSSKWISGRKGVVGPYPRPARQSSQDDLCPSPRKPPRPDPFMRAP